MEQHERIPQKDLAALTASMNLLRIPSDSADGKFFFKTVSDILFQQARQGRQPNIWEGLLQAFLQRVSGGDQKDEQGRPKKLPQKYTKAVLKEPILDEQEYPFIRFANDYTREIYTVTDDTRPNGSTLIYEEFEGVCSNDLGQMIQSKRYRLINHPIDGKDPLEPEQWLAINADKLLFVTKVKRIALVGMQNVNPFALIRPDGEELQGI